MARPDRVSQPRPRRRARSGRVGLPVVALLTALALSATACTRSPDRAAVPTTRIPGTSGPDPTDAPGTTGGAPTTSAAAAATDPSTTAPGGAALAAGDGAGRTGAPSRSLALSLANGRAPVVAADASLRVAAGTPLGAGEVRAVTDRLTPWSTASATVEAFRWPAQTLTPPRPGRTIETALGATAPPATVPVSDLKVTAHQPDGDVPIAPFATVTFNQPMVPITTIGQLDARLVPASITPAVPGRWQWVGTNTLRFDASAEGVDRLPMATQYTLTVPAGTRSATGGVLREAATFTFTTPTAQVLSMQPYRDTVLGLTPVFIAVFDQRVDPARVVAAITLRAGETRRAVRIATPAEVASDHAVRTDDLPAGRWVAFRAADAFAPDTAITVDIGPGVPSAEGPRTTDAAQSFAFRTYPPFAVREQSCDGERTDACRPGSGLAIEMTTPIDTDRFDASIVTIAPELAGRTVSASGSTLYVSGATQPRTTYTVTLGAALTDTFGQRLGDDRRLEFRIGPAQKSLRPLGNGLVTLDPLAPKPTLTIGSVNRADARLSVYRVAPDDWAAYQQHLQRFYDAQGSRGRTPTPTPPWKLLDERTVRLGGERDRFVETAVDLSSYLEAGLGHLVVRLAPTEQIAPTGSEWYANQTSFAWLQSTRIGLDAFADHTGARLWTTDLRTGAPLPGVAVRAGQQQLAATDAHGETALSGRAGLVVATLGGDRAFLVGEWDVAVQDQATWYVIDDRRTYRPGEQVAVKGWIRRFAASSDTQLHLPEATTVQWTVMDAAGVELAKGDTAVGAAGGFDLTFTVPEGANAGGAYVQFTGTLAGIGQVGYSHQFSVQDFRRPDFEVTVSPDDPAPVVSSTPAAVALHADYYAGGPLGGAPVRWNVTSSDTSYSPPGWDEYSFGEWRPWWVWRGGGPSFASDAVGGLRSFPSRGGAKNEQFTGRTAADGTHHLSIGFAGAGGALPDLPKAVQVNGSVEDVNRQEIGASTQLIVHPAKYYVGIRSARPFVREGDPLDVDAVVTSIDGKAVAGHEVVVRASRLEWKAVKGVWQEASVDEQTCTRTSGDKAVACAFTTKVGGSYRIVATITDDHGGRNRSELTVWVTGATGQPSRELRRETLTVVPGARLYNPGDTAEVLVQAPFASGHGIVTIGRVRIESTQTFELVGGTALVRVPIGATDVPGLDVSIEVVGTAPRLDDSGRPVAGATPRPAFAVGGVTLAVSKASRTLTVAAVPRATELEPGATTQVDVRVSGADGAPVAGAEFAIAVVDESVLALSGYRTPDPLDVFYGPVYGYQPNALTRDSIVLAAPQDFTAVSGALPASAEAAADTAAAAAPAPAAKTRSAALASEGAPATTLAVGAPGLGQGAAAAKIDERTNLHALAVFKPSVTTGADGKAVVEVPLPDNLTRYRVMVVAVSGADRFGSTESAITARLPISVRPSAPRFLSFGDVFELPVVVQNRGATDANVDVVVEAANLTLTAGAGRRVTVPAGDRVEVRFPAKAESVGSARLRVAAVSGAHSDAQTVELPVYTPATAEAFAAYGVIDSGAVAQPIAAPTGVVPQFGGLDVTTSSTQLGGLTDAVIYLHDYPYESADALAGRILAIVSLRDVLDQFKANDFPGREVLLAQLGTDLAALAALRRPDGGYSYWKNDLSDRADAFITVQATHALVAASAAGVRVPADVLAASLDDLAHIEQFFPPQISEHSRLTLSAYALHVRAHGGSRDSAKALALWRSAPTTMPLEAAAWLWPVLDDSGDGAKAIAEIERRIDNAVVETASAVSFTTGYSDADSVVLWSERRTDAVVLDALISRRPGSALIPKVVTGLLGHRVRGAWSGVQENAFVLLALKRYFDTYERDTPHFTAGVWLGDRYAGAQRFDGRSTDRVNVHIPTAELAGAGDADLVLSKQGEGRMYYRVGLRYAPADLRLDPLDRGFTVVRTYRGADDPADVTRDAAGVWHIKAGARVRVQLTMVAESRRTRVALVDPLPAGLEILNPDLAITPQVSDPDPSTPRADYDWWVPRWFDHQNLRDDRGEAFASLLDGGVYDWSYVAKATTPGTFVVAPARAEEIYAPETFGRSASATVVVG